MNATSTRWTLTQMNVPGGRISLKLRRRPSHERAVQGILRGVVLGLGIWILIGSAALMVWRAMQ